MRNEYLIHYLTPWELLTKYWDMLRSDLKKVKHVQLHYPPNFFLWTSIRSDILVNISNQDNSTPSPEQKGALAAL